MDRIGGCGGAELSSERGERMVQATAATDHGEAALQAIQLLDSSGLFGGLEAVGHRVVHGGPRFSGPVLTREPRRTCRGPTIAGKDGLAAALFERLDIPKERMASLEAKKSMK